MDCLITLIRASLSPDLLLDTVSVAALLLFEEFFLGRLALLELFHPVLRLLAFLFELELDSIVEFLLVIKVAFACDAAHA